MVVVGGGCGGLEAARVSAKRSHEVILFEATGALGGQVLLAARAKWRRERGGIAHWLAERIERLGVDIRLNAVAEAGDVTAEGPDVVIVATGGLPNVGFFDGAEHVTTAWDVLGGHAEAGGRVLVCDENGSHHGPSCAEHLASRGVRVEIATPDRALCNEMAETNQGAHLNELYRHGVRIRPDTRLVGVRREGSHLVAVLANMFTGEREQREGDQVIGDCDTLPNDGLYFELKPGSTNLGEVDLQAMADARPQDLCTNPDGAYRLFRVGDAWASRFIRRMRSGAPGGIRKASGVRVSSRMVYYHIDRSLSPAIRATAGCPNGCVRRAEQSEANLTAKVWSCLPCAAAVTFGVGCAAGRNERFA